MNVAIDIGCGGKKRDGCIGIDIAAAPGVDHVLNLVRDPLPFADRSVDSIYSSHCFEHLSSPNNIWREISRVAKPNATIEIWTPYAHSDEAYLPGHIFNWAPMNWAHVSSDERAFYSKHFLQGGYWRWTRTQYVIPHPLRLQLEQMNIPVAFAIRHMVNVVREWGCFFEYVLEDPGEHKPQEVFSHMRGDEFYPL